MDIICVGEMLVVSQARKKKDSMYHVTLAFTNSDYTRCFGRILAYYAPDVVDDRKASSKLHSRHHELLPMHLPEYLLHHLNLLL
jgi:hypothetical protein